MRLKSARALHSTIIKIEELIQFQKHFYGRVIKIRPEFNLEYCEKCAFCGYYRQCPWVDWRDCFEFRLINMAY